jgi:hypothetical protein
VIANDRLIDDVCDVFDQIHRETLGAEEDDTQRDKVGAEKRIHRDKVGAEEEELNRGNDMY